MAEVNCGDCGAPMILKPSKFKNPFYYQCPNYPICRGAHGAHPDGSPMGIPADKATREARIEAHRVFDDWTTANDYGRNRAYRELSELMDLDKDEAHISKFDEDECNRLIELIEGL